MTETNDFDDLPPPSHPPPLLAPTDIERLCSQGHLSLRLPDLWTARFGELFGEADNFFALPDETKSAAFPCRHSDTEQGYTRIPDEKEYLTIRYATSTGESSHSAAQVGLPSASAEAAAIEKTIAEVWRDAAHLLHRILADVSNFLGIAPKAWDGVVLDSLHLPPRSELATPTLLRVFRYEPAAGGADPHRDLGLLTLCVCRGRGLEVLEFEPAASTGGNLSSASPGGSKDVAEGGSSHAAADQNQLVPVWRDAGEFTVLTGDTLRILSGNRIQAAPHRVVPTDEGRNSIVFALRATTRNPIDLAALGGQGTLDSLDFWKKIKSRRFNVNAQKEVRERQRELRKNRSGVGKSLAREGGPATSDAAVQDSASSNCSAPGGVC